MVIKKFISGFVCAGVLLFGVHMPVAADTVITVQGVPVGSMVTLGGTVIPFMDVTFAAQIPGRIKSIAGEEGDQFGQGVELVAIADDDLLARRRAAIANHTNAEAALRNAGVQYSREVISPYGGEANDSMGGLGSMMKGFTNPMQGIMGGNSSPGMDRHAQLYQQGTMLEQARGQLIAARSAIEEIDTKIRDARSIAPFDGVITKKFVEVGDPVQPGQPLIKFSDLSKMQIKLEVPARLMPGVKKDMIFRARLDVGNVLTQARVAQIYPIADEDRHTVTVKLDLPPGAPGGAGMYAEVELRDINAAVVDLPVVPVEALVWRGSLPGLYVLNDQNKREMRLVRTGDPVGSDKISILSGLRVGERIFIKGGESSNPASSWN
ncbi:MAG: efflux RND transporter periplasmic adaptor subunit [Gammaproteobacteria bacterium]